MDLLVNVIARNFSAKILGNKIILKVLNPNKNSIFLGDVFKALNGEDFFFELIKLFGLEDDFGELRFNLKSVSISMMENYKKLPGEVYNKKSAFLHLIL